MARLSVDESRVPFVLLGGQCIIEKYHMYS